MQTPAQQNTGKSPSPRQSHSKPRPHSLLTKAQAHHHGLSSPPPPKKTPSSKHRALKYGASARILMGESSSVSQSLAQCGLSRTRTSHIPSTCATLLSPCTATFPAHFKE
eukprot:1136680-Pelagomonas_calceolata.AAC.5